MACFISGLCMDEFRPFFAVDVHLGHRRESLADRHVRAVRPPLSRQTPATLGAFQRSTEQEFHAVPVRGSAQLIVACCERQASPHGELQIGSVACRQLLRAGEGEDFA